MAPKRKSARMEAPAQKKQKKTEKKVDTREQWQIDSEDLSAVLAHYDKNEKIRDLLHDVCGPCFELLKSDRHPFYHQFIDMIGQTLQDLMSDADSKLAATQHIIDNADNIKFDYILAKSQAETSLEEKRDIVKSKEDIKQQQEEKLEVSEKYLEMKNEELDTHSALLNKLERALSDAESKAEIFKELDSPCVLSSPENAKSQKEIVKNQKKNMAAVTTLFKKIGMEDSLLTAVPIVLGKTPEQRGSFDVKVIDEVRQQIASFVHKLKEEIAHNRHENEEIQCFVEEAKKISETCSFDLSKTEEEIEIIREDIKELNAKKKSADKSVKDHSKNMAKNQSDHDDNTSFVHSLKETYNKFQSLRDRDHEVNTKEEQAPVQVEEITVDESGATDEIVID